MTDYSKPATHAPVWLYAAIGVLWVYRLPVRFVPVAPTGAAA